jgi:hypothetical protein
MIAVSSADTGARRGRSPVAGNQIPRLRSCAKAYQCFVELPRFFFDFFQIRVARDVAVKTTWGDHGVVGRKADHARIM